MIEQEAPTGGRVRVRDPICLLDASEQLWVVVQVLLWFSRGHYEYTIPHHKNSTSMIDLDLDLPVDLPDTLYLPVVSISRFMML